MKIHEALSKAEQILQKNDVQDPRWNAERVLMVALQKSRTQLYGDLNKFLSTDEKERYFSLLEKRSKHYPLAYLEGTQEFFGGSFVVDESVLIPRPETEELIRMVLELPLPKPAAVLDLGAGSGNIAVTLARELPASNVTAVEKSQDALKILRINSSKSVRIVRADIFAAPFLSASFNLIVSNPPYVEQIEFEDLPEETLWEPRAALLTNSLEETYQKLMEQSARLLRPGGYFACEIGHGQLDRIRKIGQTCHALKFVSVRNDGQLIPRTLLYRKHNRH